MTLLVIIVCVLWVLRAAQEASERRMHERLAEHALEQAQLYKPGSPAYRAAMVIGRAHAHKAGFPNGYKPSEWNELRR